MRFDHFSLIAPIYARLGHYQDLEAMLLHADLPASGRMLDLGGGTGRIARELMAYTDMTVVADVSRGMLRYAGRVRGLMPLGSASEYLPFPNGSFTRIIMVDALHHVADPQRSAREMWRVLAAGGRLVIVEPDIRTFGVKLIALAEKLMLMRSHFLGPEEIPKLFPQGSPEVQAEEGSLWIIVQKTSG